MTSSFLKSFQPCLQHVIILLQNFSFDTEWTVARNGIQMAMAQWLFVQLCCWRSLSQSLLKAALWGSTFSSNGAIARHVAAFRRFVLGKVQCKLYKVNSFSSSWPKYNPSTFSCLIAVCPSDNRFSYVMRVFPAVINWQTATLTSSLPGV